MPYLELKNITKKYDKLVAVDELNFSVEKNEFAVLFGSSAAGKTTTLRCISGLEKIENGEVWFNDNDFTNAPIQGRQMAMVFQTFALYPHLTTEENLAYPLKKKKIDKSEILKRISEISEMLRIGHALKRKPDTLSGGEQQRLSLARALLINPSLLLLDEPTANLDPYSLNLIEEIILDENKKGKTIILTTHDMGQAKRLAKEILFFNKGKLLEQTKAINFFKKPKTKEAQSYINGKILL